MIDTTLKVKAAMMSALTIISFIAFVIGLIIIPYIVATLTILIAVAWFSYGLYRLYLIGLVKESK
jgi:hypothetical protein